MRLIICGSRDIGADTHRHIADSVDAMVESLRNATNRRVSGVLSGACRGVDALGEEWARIERVPVRRFPADWSLGPKAGPIRNQTMVDEAVPSSRSATRTAAGRRTASGARRRRGSRWR